MENLISQVISTLKSNGCHYSKISPYMNHVVIEIPDAKNFEHEFDAIKRAVLGCVNHQLPKRDQDILFDVRNTEQECSFKAYKNLEKVH